MSHLYLQIIGLNNLYKAYDEFKKGKRNKIDVAEYEMNLDENIHALRRDLLNRNYKHSDYIAFKVSDPKPRIIHKASVNDRVLHQAVFRIINPLFERHFIYDSYSSRIGKGTHRSVERLNQLIKRDSQNYNILCYAIKLDVRKFFDNIDHELLLHLIKRKIYCVKTLRLIRIIIDSFNVSVGRGLPLGNVTSQLFANIYLTPIDNFAKNHLKIKHYLRYCDDIIIVKNNKDFLNETTRITNFAKRRLRLDMKIGEPRKLQWGFDWLGYIELPNHRILRIKTARRMFKALARNKSLHVTGVMSMKQYIASMNSYLGLLKHCNSYKIKGNISKQIINKDVNRDRESV